MEEEITIALLEANREPPSRQEVLERFKVDFRKRWDIPESPSPQRPLALGELEKEAESIEPEPKGGAPEGEDEVVSESGEEDVTEGVYGEKQPEKSGPSPARDPADKKKKKKKRK